MFEEISELWRRKKKKNLHSFKTLIVPRWPLTPVGRMYCVSVRSGRFQQSSLDVQALLSAHILQTEIVRTANILNKGEFASEIYYLTFLLHFTTFTPACRGSKFVPKSWCTQLTRAVIEQVNLHSHQILLDLFMIRDLFKCHTIHVPTFSTVIDNRGKKFTVIKDVCISRVNIE